MRIVLIILLLLYSIIGFAQGWGVLERTSTPNAPTGASHSKFYYNSSLKELYFYDGTNWRKYTERIDRISGGNAPNYTPTAADAKIAVNANGELYYYNNGWFSMLGWGLQGNNPSSSDYIGTKNNETFKLKSKNRNSLELDNNGTINALNLAEGNNIINVKPTTTGGNLTIKAGDSSNGLQQGSTTISNGIGTQQGNILFNIYGTNGAAFYHIFSDDKLGINESSPTANLHVNGTARIDQGSKNGQNKVLTCLDGNGNAEWKDVNTVFYNQFDVVNSDVVQLIPTSITLQDSKTIGNYYPLRVKGANKVCVSGYANGGTAAAGNITIKIQTGLGAITKISLPNGDINSFCQDLDTTDSTFNVTVNTLTGVTNLSGFFINIYQLN